MEIRGLSAGLLLCVLAVTAILTGCGKKPEVVEERPVRTIVFFGDSVTNGYGVDRDTESFVGRISLVMASDLFGPVRVINAGRNGDDTSEALTRVTEDVTSHNPDFAVIAFGLNDSQNSSITPAVFRHNMENIIAALPSRTKIFITTANAFLDTGQSNRDDLNTALDVLMDELRSLADERSIALIDVHDAWNDQMKRDSRNIESYYIDPTHPSPKGHGVLYEAHMNVLRRAFRQ